MSLLDGIKLAASAVQQILVVYREIKLAKTNQHAAAAAQRLIHCTTIYLATLRAIQADLATGQMRLSPEDERAAHAVLIFDAKDIEEKVEKAKKWTERSVVWNVLWHTNDDIENRVAELNSMTSLLRSISNLSIGSSTIVDAEVQAEELNAFLKANFIVRNGSPLLQSGIKLTMLVSHLATHWRTKFRRPLVAEMQDVLAVVLRTNSVREPNTANILADSISVSLTELQDMYTCFGSLQSLFLNAACVCTDKFQSQPWFAGRMSTQLAKAKVDNWFEASQDQSISAAEREILRWKARVGIVRYSNRVPGKLAWTRLNIGLEICNDLLDHHLEYGYRISSPNADPLDAAASSSNSSNPSPDPSESVNVQWHAGLVDLMADVSGVQIPNSLAFFNKLQSLDNLPDYGKSGNAREAKHQPTGAASAAPDSSAASTQVVISGRRRTAAMLQDISAIVVRIADSASSDLNPNQSAATTNSKAEAEAQRAWLEIEQLPMANEFASEDGNWIGEGNKNGTRPHDMGLVLRFPRTLAAAASSTVSTSAAEENKISYEDEDDALELEARNVNGTDLTNKEGKQLWGALCLDVAVLHEYGLSSGESDDLAANFEITQNPFVMDRDDELGSDPFVVRLRARIVSQVRVTNKRWFFMTLETPYGNFTADGSFASTIRSRATDKNEQVNESHYAVGQWVVVEGYPLFNVDDVDE